MIILTIRSDNQQAEIGVYNDYTQLSYQQWQAHRELADTIHTKIVDVLMQANIRLHELQGIVVFKGPGSFTGLRIGISVANALAYSLDLPIVATTGEDWLRAGSERLLRGEREAIAMPEYGAEPNITKPKR